MPWNLKITNFRDYGKQQKLCPNSSVPCVLASPTTTLIFSCLRWCSETPTEIKRKLWKIHSAESYRESERTHSSLTLFMDRAWVESSLTHYTFVQERVHTKCKRQHKPFCSHCRVTCYFRGEPSAALCYPTVIARSTWSPPEPSIPWPVFQNMTPCICPDTPMPQTSWSSCRGRAARHSFRAWMILLTSCSCPCKQNRTHWAGAHRQGEEGRGLKEFPGYYLPS